MPVGVNVTTGNSPLPRASMAVITPTVRADSRRRRSA